MESLAKTSVPETGAPSGSAKGRQTRQAIIDCALQMAGRIGLVFLGCFLVGSSRVDLQACKLEYSIVSPK